MEKITPFITSIWVEELSDQNHLVEEILLIKNKDTELIQKSNQGGWQSVACSTNIYPFLDSTLLEINEKVETVYRELGIAHEPKLKNFWFNCNSKNDYNLTHVHAYSFVSAVLYLRVPEDSGNIVFNRPDNFENFIDNAQHPTENNIRSFFLVPKNNLLVIFPSYLPHYVERNNSDHERISLALNFG